MHLGVQAGAEEGTIKLNELIQDVDGAVIDGDGTVDIEQLEYDSREICAPALFFAVKGFKEDGYDYVKSAVAKGAMAVAGERDSCKDVGIHIKVPNIRRAMADISARFYGFPGKRLKVCGVTGTNGKTTTCFIIKQILEARNKTAGLVTSLHYDTTHQIFPAQRTTPEALDLQRLFFLMKKAHCVNAVIEVSSHALSLHRVDHVNFRVAVFTNITRDHLDFHESMDKYIEAKAELIKKLDGPLSYAVINLDVPEFQLLFGDIQSKFMSYSLSNDEADVYCQNYELKPNGTIFDLITPMGNFTVEYQLPGRFNLYNALAAATAGLACGVDIDNVVLGLESSRSIPGRLEAIDCGQPFTLFVDYAHTPDAISRLCETVRELTDGRILLLFGCGGDRDRGKRPLMGKAAIEGADEIVVTSDNPRGEDPMSIIDEIKPGLSGEEFEIIPDREKAVETILKKAKKNDTVILAGKGAEKFQEIKGEMIDYDERSEARKILAQMGYSAVSAGEGR